MPEPLGTPPLDGPRVNDPFTAAREELSRRMAAERLRARAEHPDHSALDEVLIEVADLRPLPHVAQRIIVLHEGRFSPHELSEIISTDQALTSKLLRLANSAYYGFPRRITTARDAVVLLGFRTVRSAALTSCLMQTAGAASNLDYRAFWQFSIATGVMAQLLARTERAHEREAFTAGVLHQLGLLALDQGRPEQLAEALALWQRAGMTRREAEREVFGFTAAELGGALALHWNFPEALAEAVREHDRPLDTLPEPKSLAATVLRARMFVRAHGLSDGAVPASTPVEAPEEWLRPPLSYALRQTGGVERVMEQVEALVGALG